jgi:S-adenosylmethionine-diacylglycerol 3-amino-3-carboxypropyl transferase
MNRYFTYLNYSIGDEDTMVEYSILPENANHVVAIAGSGGRIIPLLARHPQTITCIDISMQQLSFTALRIELVKNHDYETYVGFLGYSDSLQPEQRKDILENIDVEDKYKKILFGIFKYNCFKEPIYYGQFEKTLIKLSHINNIITRGEVKKIFNTSSLDSQIFYYLNNFPKLRWNIVLRLLGNSAMLNAFLYKGDFPQKNIANSYYSIYKKIFENLFTKIEAKKSFFLQLICFGKLKFSCGLPLECNKNIFMASKKSLKHCNVRLINGSINSFIQQQENISFISLSDVLSFMDDKTSINLLAKIHQNLSTNCNIVSRGHVKVIQPDITGYKDMTSSYQKIIENELTQLWNINVYKKL